MKPSNDKLHNGHVIQSGNRTSAPGEMSLHDSRSENHEEEKCLDEQMRSGKPPLFKDMCLWEKRLSTYPSDFHLISRCNYSPEELAVGGFYFTGSGDCVRCFYCGLGLKGWSASENMYVEHQRYRPSCGFLKVILGSTNQIEFGLLTKATVNLAQAKSSLSIQDKVCLLQSENKYLKQRQLCRMCFRNPARELLMPCGELIICEQCCDIISSCPSCQQKIVATTTVFTA